MIPILNVIYSLGGELKSIIIDELDEPSHSYRAKLRIVRSRQLILWDIRPSDALIVAVLAKVPVYVDEAVFAATDRWRECARQ